MADAVTTVAEFTPGVGLALEIGRGVGAAISGDYAGLAQSAAIIGTSVFTGGNTGVAKLAILTAVSVTKHAGKVTKGGGNLFRVVDDVELADIKKTGAFRPGPNSIEGKQFVDNLGDAQKLQRRFSEFFGGNQTIVRGQAPQSVIDDASKVPFSDIPKGTAITVPIKDLPAVKPRL